MGALGVVQYMAGDPESSPKQQWRWLCATFFRKLKRYRMQNERKETHILRNETKCICTPYRKCNLIKRTVTRSSLRMLCRVAAFCRPLRPVLLLVSFPRSRSPVVWCVGAVLNVAGCAVCTSAAPNNWRIEDVLVVARVV